MKKNKKVSKLTIGLIIIGIIFLIVGFYLLYIANPKRIAAKSLKVLNEKTIDFVEYFKFDTDINSHTTDSNITINATSHYFDNHEEYLSYSKLFKKLKDSKTNVIIIKDYDRKDKLVSINTTINGKSFLNSKEYIHNSTSYYYNQDISKNYINRGNDMYFEVINNGNEEKLVKHLINNIYKSVGASFTNRDFNTSIIKEDNKTYNKINITIDNNKALNILNKIIADLKKDKKANFYITSNYPEFKNYEISKDKKILNKLSIDIYTSRFTYKIKKYIVKYDNLEIVIRPTSNNNYEGTINNNYSFKTKKGNITIYNNNEEIGSFKIKKTNTNLTIESDVVTNKLDLNTSYSLIISNLVKKDHYDLKQELISKIYYEKENILDLDLNIESTIKKSTNIEEDISNSILESSLKDQEKEKLAAFYDDIYNSLIS